jgi:hypothetical protein
MIGNVDGDGITLEVHYFGWNAVGDVIHLPVDEIQCPMSNDFIQPHRS